MKTLLDIRASLFGGASSSAALADRFLAAWRSENPDGRVLTRSLLPGAFPSLTAARYRAFNTPVAERTPAQRADVAFSDELVAELEDANDIVLTAPMYNFSVPATLRDYFDHIARAGVTFRYTPNGPEGLLRGKQVYVVITRGGRYSGAADTQRPYLEQFLGFLGLTNVEFVMAEGLAMGDDARRASLDHAEQHIDSLAQVAA